MGCCHVKNQCLVIRLPKEIDHYQAEKVWNVSKVS